MDTPNTTAQTNPTSRPCLARRVVRLLRQTLWEIALTVLPAVFITLVVNVFVAQATVIDGPSMQPNLYYKQRVIVEKITYRFTHGPRRGDVVTIEMPGEKQTLIKRVVALGGETVSVRGGRVWINDAPLDEHWATERGGPDYGPQVVPPGHVFVLGDNRGNSRDSRYFGPVPVFRILGHALLVYWPLDRFRPLQ